MKNRTQKQIRPMIKADTDNFVMEMIDKYPEILRTSLEDYIRQEILYAFEEIKDEGKILTNAQRWRHV